MNNHGPPDSVIALHKKAPVTACRPRGFRLKRSGTELCLSSRLLFPWPWWLAPLWSSWLLLSDTDVTTSCENYSISRQDSWTS